ncbi:AraC family transcriptional regulator [Yinghuangia soli]|uniref:AraC family transcriptional regulator n=1 Tax=Yinghuangia soli TaxID=2908204 RepID=A0AA41Q5G7_9ACTN|nr:AraC family transcriptional regulator [Yinghuangia soli]MCF2531656.1 AraC family transcriptional regulator [Yinghuangia soli]
MDVLSDVVAVARTGRPRAAHVRWHAPWAQEFAAVPGSAGFQVVLSGSCRISAPGAEPVELGEGDVLFLPHGSGHVLADGAGELPAAGALVVPGEACGPDDRPGAAPFAADQVDPTGRGGPATVLLCGAYQLDPRAAHPLLRGLPDRIHLRADAERHRELGFAVALLAAELENPRPGTDAAVPALLDTLLLYILRIWFAEPAAGESRPSWSAALADAPVSVALDAIHRAPGEPWTVAKLAAEAGLSRAAFARRFAALVGQPPLGYLTWWRMTTAARLLRTTDAPLRTIAAQVGYASEYAFAGTFKRTRGTAPGTYRRAAREGQSQELKSTAPTVFGCQ